MWYETTERYTDCRSSETLRERRPLHGDRRRAVRDQGRPRRPSRDAEDHPQEAYWRSTDSNVHAYTVINRGGALLVDECSTTKSGEARGKIADAWTTASSVGLRCALWDPFIGYDGQYYLCCSDWKKQAPMGSVFDHTFLDVMRAKLEFVELHEPVCRSCGHDPLNGRFADTLREYFADGNSTTTSRRKPASSPRSERARLVDEHVSTLLADAPARAPVPLPNVHSGRAGVNRSVSFGLSSNRSIRESATDPVVTFERRRIVVSTTSRRAQLRRHDGEQSPRSGDYPELVLAGVESANVVVPPSSGNPLSQGCGRPRRPTCGGWTVCETLGG